MLKKDDLLISAVGATFGKSYLHTENDQAHCYAGYLVKVTPGADLLPGFLAYWSESDDYWYQVRSRVIQATIQNFSAAKVRDLSLLVPPVETQRALCDFLDRETAQAEALVTKYERLIELLEEKRAALITQAVTKGLDSKVPLKDSGVQWIGMIPAHWTCTALNRFATRVVVGIAEAATHAYADEGVPILRSTNIRANSIRGDILRIQREFALERGSKLIRAGDLVTVRTGNAGVTAVVPNELDGCQCFTMLITSLRSACIPGFFSLAINSDYGQRYFALEAWGTAQANISVPILKAFPIAVPPVEEQARIVRYLGGQLATLDDLIRRTGSAIELLNERRTALITAAVTGQIDVRPYRHTKPPMEVAV